MGGGAVVIGGNGLVARSDSLLSKIAPFGVIGGKVGDIVASAAKLPGELDIFGRLRMFVASVLVSFASAGRKLGWRGRVSRKRGEGNKEEEREADGDKN